MPKVLLYITARITWIFLFFGTDVNENRAHIHVGKRGIDNYCKIWLEPTISVADTGDLTSAQIKQIVQITTTHRNKLMEQWRKFKNGSELKIITIKK